jgi:hypothetical protein
MIRTEYNSGILLISVILLLCTLPNILSAYTLNDQSYCITHVIRRVTQCRFALFANSIRYSSVACPWLKSYPSKVTGSAFMKILQGLFSRPVCVQLCHWPISFFNIIPHSSRCLIFILLIYFQVTMMGYLRALTAVESGWMVKESHSRAPGLGKTLKVGSLVARQVIRAHSSYGSFQWSNRARPPTSWTFKLYGSSPMWSWGWSPSLVVY